MVSMLKRQVLLETLSLASAMASMLVLYSAIGVIANTESPIVVVLSGSMEPAFRRGDILFLANPPNEPYIIGDIVVYKVPGAEIPIVHRIIETHDELPLDFNEHDTIQTHERSRSTSSEKVRSGNYWKPRNNLKDEISTPVRGQLLLTKGDNNPADDISLYNGLDWIRREHVVGKVWGFLPYVGYGSIAMNDMPRLKYAIFAAIWLASLVQRE